MTESRQLSREEVARIEIGHTAISRPLAWWLAVAFCLLAVAVPVVEVGRGLAAGTGPWRELAAAAKAAVEAARAAGLIPANRELLAGMGAYEDRLEESSAVAEVVLPPAQWLLTAILEAGNEQAYPGRRGWLFFRPDVDHLTGPGFLEPAVLAARARGGESWEEPPHPDPRPALTDFARQLQARGIALVVVPTPVKPSVHPERLAPGSWEGRRPVSNPSFELLVQSLEAAGIPVFDPAPVLVAAARETGSPQYLATDTHWTPQAVDRVAGELVRFLRQRGLVPEQPVVTYPRRPVRVANTGDVTRMLKLPAWSELFPPEEVTLQQVRRPDGRPWRPDPQADLLLLGDSFTNVFSQAGLGWGEGAGLAEQLSYHLGRPVDRIAVNAGGAYTAREQLAASLARGEDRLAGKRLVFYQFATRELSGGDWKLIALGGGQGEATGEVAQEEAPQGEATREGVPAVPGEGAAAPSGLLPRRELGEGFLVWESKRTGAWRIWTRRLDGSGLRQLSPDEPGRHHCCPHISPDGRRVVYLSRTVGGETYPEKEVPGKLWLVQADGSGRRLLAEEARTYGWGNRAAVWRSDGELIYVGGDGRTYLLEIGLLETDSGASRPLTTQPREALGWLIDSTLSWAVTAAPNFSVYDAASRRVAEREPFAGCEPYFSHDGRWGFWVAGGGGPVNRIDLADRRISTLLARDDPRLSAEQRYVYFPMVSRDGRLFAYGASRGPEEHDHFQANYEIYAAPMDPESLELLGQPVRMTTHPAPDRYPDLFAEPLELGYHAGEAPFTVRLEPEPEPGAGPDRWSWDWGDGAREQGRVGEHTYRRPGVYTVQARRGGRELRGQVVVAPAAPPRVVAVVPREGGRELLVRFDEAVRLEKTSARLESGRAISGAEPGADGRSLVIRLGEELGGGDRLWLDGITDRAPVPNPMPGQWFEIEPPAWPSDRRDLYFLWQTADAPNLAYDPELTLDRAFPLELQGRARLSGDGALVLEEGAWYGVPNQAAENLRQAMRANAAVTIEATLTPARPRTPGWAPIVSFRSRGGQDEVTLGQSGRFLVLRVRDAGSEGEGTSHQLRLIPAAAGERMHLVVSYTAGRLTVYRDGEEVLTSREVGTGFAGWRRGRLDFGVAGDGGVEWEGTLQGVALYGRAMGAAEARENALRYRRFLQGRRQEVQRIELLGRLEAKSKIPTLREISPYRRALAVYQYRVVEVLSGRYPGGRIRVAHWVILDGERQGVAAAGVGDERRLTLEPFAANPQLEGHYLSDTLPSAPEMELYYALE